MTKPVTSLAVVVPCFNNCGSIPQLVDELHRCLGLVPNLDYKLILVDDGSTDKSWSEIEEVCKGTPRVRGIKLSRNFGQVNAIMCGLDEFDEDCVVVISADLQDPVELIPRMFEAFQCGNEVVICHRESREDKPYERFLSFMIYWLIRRVIPDFPRGGFDYFLLSKRAAKLLARNHTASNYLQGSIMQLGFNRYFIPYHRNMRTHGTSGWTLRKKLIYSLDIFTSLSYSPLMFFSALGTLFTAFGMASIIYVFYLRIHKEVPFDGFATIVILILISSGLILQLLSWIGQYVIRILREAKSLSPYLIEKHT